MMGFPGDPEVKVSACNEGELGSIPESGKSPGERNGYPLQYPCLENFMGRAAWRVTVYGVAELNISGQLTLSLCHTRVPQFGDLPKHTDHEEQSK